MRTIALFFSTISLLPTSINAQSTHYEYRGVCQIAEYANVDISRQCSGEYIYVQDPNVVMIGISDNDNDKDNDKFIAFVGEWGKNLYSGNHEDKRTPLLIKVSRVAFSGHDVVTGPSSFCLIAATKSLDGQLVRCHARGLDGKVFQVLFYTPQNLDAGP